MQSNACQMHVKTISTAHTLSSDGLKPTIVRPLGSVGAGTTSADCAASPGAGLAERRLSCCRQSSRWMLRNASGSVLPHTGHATWPAMHEVVGLAAGGSALLALCGLLRGILGLWVGLRNFWPLSWFGGRHKQQRQADHQRVIYTYCQADQRCLVVHTRYLRCSVMPHRRVL